MSKEYDHFWKFHNSDNMDVHAVKLIENLEAENKRLRDVLEFLVVSKANDRVKMECVERALKGE